MSVRIPTLAQGTVPPVTISSTATFAYPASAAEALYHVTVQEARGADAISIQQRAYPKDSMHVVIVRSAQRWLTSLGHPPEDGLQRDPYSAIAVLAGQEPVARQVIATRLATPGLSLDARARTYAAAIRAFTTPDIPAHLPIAEQYLTQLEALGPQAAYWQHMAHRGLVGAYYLLGRSVDVARHGTRAIELLAVMPYIHRRDTNFSDDAEMYAETIDALAGQPEGIRRIRALNAILLSLWTPPAELAAQDSGVLVFAANARREVSQMIATGMRVGTRGDDIVGPQWVNMPRQIDRFSVADGRIHVVELGHYSCPPCQQAMVALQRVQDQYPDIQVINATATEGTWGFRLVSPDTEVKQLAAYYTVQLKIRYPITIWPGVLKPTSDGGMLPENDGPNFAHYPMAGKPNIYVIDGHGIIRRVFVGALTRERELQLTHLLDSSLHESHEQ